MAHPYKQKYNNFNGPGHQSPVESWKIGWKILEGGYKLGKNQLGKLWKGTKNAFVKRNFDNSVDWTKTKSHLGKLAIGQAALVKGGDMLKSFNEENERIRERDNLRSNEEQWDKTINNKLRITNEPNLDSLINTKK